MRLHCIINTRMNFNCATVILRVTNFFSRRCDASQLSLTLYVTQSYLMANKINTINIRILCACK